MSEEKILFFDVDGTIVTADHHIPKSTVEALYAARERGHRLVINTGRPYLHVEPQVKALPFDGFVCALGGHIVFEGRELIHTTFSHEESCRIRDIGHECGMQFLFESEKGVFCNPDNIPPRGYEEFCWLKSIGVPGKTDIDSDTFAFDKLSRWVEMCKRCGVEYYEVAHMFTQWGANFTPNIYASVDGTYKRIFGWDKSSTGDEYKEFLDAYLPALKKAFTEMGIADKCFFHVSDEPSVDHLESYLSCKALLEKHLAGFKFIDALSDITFYNSGAVKKPVPATNHIKPFLDANIDGLWAYYCIGQYKDVSNSFAYMPSARTRILGAQLFKYDIEGFLQWGYNFYNSQFSDYPIDPYYSGDCEGFGPTGDAFQVYPGYDGMPEDSLRLMVVFHGIQDLRAMQLLASLTDKKTVVDMIDAEGEVEFDKYPKSKEYIFELRRKINKAIVEASK